MTSPEATEREKLKTLKMLLKRTARFKQGNLEGPISLWTGQNVSKPLRAGTCVVRKSHGSRGCDTSGSSSSQKLESKSLLFASFPSSDNLQEYKTE